MTKEQAKFWTDKELIRLHIDYKEILRWDKLIDKVKSFYIEQMSLIENELNQRNFTNE